MADIRPFQAIRPAKERIAEIAELPYDVFNREEARALVEKRPHSFLVIDRPETQFEPGHDMYADEVYAKAKEMLWDWVEDGSFIQDKNPCYYIYQLTMDGRTQTGICACASIEDYENGVIKKHENTRAEKEQDRIRHVDTCNAQTGPIFLAYRANEQIGQVVEACMKKAPLYDLTREDGTRHTVWLMDEPEQIEAVEKAFAGIQNIYIADGHHRCASAVKVGLKRASENPNDTGKEPYHYFLSVLFPDRDLMIMDYNRVVKDLNGLSEEEFLKQIEKAFLVTKAGEKDCPADYRKPDQKGEFGLYLNSGWYRLQIRPEFKNSDPVEGLDVSLLQNNLLAPVLGILDPKTDSRIDFVGGIRGMEELERRVAGDCVAAFSLYPTSIQELFAVADAGKLMPPKSTWFEPKLLSGIFIHSLA